MNAIWGIKKPAGRQQVRRPPAGAMLSSPAYASIGNAIRRPPHPKPQICGVDAPLPFCRLFRLMEPIGSTGRVAPFVTTPSNFANLRSGQRPIVGIGTGPSTIGRDARSLAVPSIVLRGDCCITLFSDAQLLSLVALTG